jgi:HEAT repeat protein
MKKLLYATAFLAAGTLGMQSVALSHGGTYRGPGDTVPPGGGGGGGGGGPSTPGPSGPSAPGPSGPKTPGPATPGGPAGGPSGPAKPRTGGATDSVDLTVWTFWWAFNREPYLNLKSAIHSGSVLTGSEDFYLGRGTKDQTKDTLRPAEADIRQKVVPALIKALNNEQSNDILSSCLVALAKIGDAKDESGESKMASEIKKFLTNGSQEVAETAAVALGILANDANTKLLIAMMEDDTSALRNAPNNLQITGDLATRTRAFAAYGLGLIGYRTTDATVRAQINDACVKLLDGEGKTLGTRDIQVACLTSMGLTALPVEVTSTPEGAATTTTTLRTRGDQLKWLMKFYLDETNNFMIRAHAPIAMGRLLTGLDDPALKAEVATQLITDLSKHSTKQAEIQQSCALALGMIGDCDADKQDTDIRTALMTVLEDLADQQTRNFALIALGQVAGRPGKGSGDPIAAVLAGKKEGNPRSFLADQLAKGKSAVQTWSALAIAIMERSLDDAQQTSSSDMKDMLRTVLADEKSPQQVGAYAIACGIVKDLGAKDVLIKNLDEVKDIEARGYTAVALGMMNERSAVQPIQDIVKKSKYQPELLKSAAIGLGLLGDKQLVPDLITMLSEASGLSAQAAISSALGFIGDARSLDPLIAMLEDTQKTDLARAFAAVALGIVADKEDLPWNSKIGVNINYRANTTTLTDQKGGILDIL